MASTAQKIDEKLIGDNAEVTEYVEKVKIGITEVRKRIDQLETNVMGLLLKSDSGKSTEGAELKQEEAQPVNEILKWAEPGFKKEEPIAKIAKPTVEKEEDVKKNAIGVLEMYKKIIFDGAGGEYDALREEIRKLEETLFGTIKVIPSLQLNISHNPPIQTALFNTQWLLIASSNLDTYLNRNKKHSREAGKYKVLKFEMDSKEVPGDVPIVNELRTYHLDGTSFTRHFTHKNTGTMQFTEGVSYKLCYNFIKDNALVSRELSVCGKNRKENLEQVSRSFENGYLLIRNEIHGVKCSRKFVRIEF